MDVKYILLTHGHYDTPPPCQSCTRPCPRRNLYPQCRRQRGGQPPVPLAGQIPDLKFYDEGDALTLGELTIQVLHTPGHSPGSVTYRVGDVLFCGDTLFAGSCGRTDFVGGSYPQILKSLKRLVSLEGNLRVCPGHEGTSSLDVERAHNPFVREALR